MRAVGLRAYGPLRADALVDFEAPRPAPPTGHDVVVRVKAVSTNPVDWKARVGAFDNPTTTFDPPKILGWDAAGVIEAVGPEATLLSVGDEIYYAGSIARSGTNAELHVVDSRIAAKKPTTLDFAAAAAFPLTALTAWESLFERLLIPRDGSAAGKTLLIVNGAWITPPSGALARGS